MFRKCAAAATRAPPTPLELVGCRFYGMRSAPLRTAFLPALSLCLCAACRAPSAGGSAALPAAPEPRELATREFPIDVERYSLELALDPARRALEGSERLRFVARAERVSAIELDLAGLEVRAVRDEQGQPLAFRRTGERLEIALGAPLARGAAREIAIDYGGVPRRGLYFAAERDGQPTQAYTQGECQDARAWFPCVDHPSERASSEIVLRMPKGWSAVCAGERIERRELEDGVLERWRANFPHPAYLETLCAGEFAELASSWDGIPLSYRAAPQFAGLLQTSFDETPGILAWLSHATGVRYPYPKYAQSCVADFPFGGMENVSATTLTDASLIDEKGQRDGTPGGLIAHEAAHQWFGDLVTCADWSQAWLNEGFATYFGALYTAEAQGADEFDLALDDMRASNAERNRGAQRRAVVWGRCVDPIDLFLDGQVYAGAAVRLHLLRHVLGDSAFFRGVHDYLVQHAGGSATTADLRGAFERASGRELGLFFEQWFLAKGHPEFEIAWTFDAGAHQLCVSVEQRQRVEDGTPAAFQTPAEIEIQQGEQTRTERIEVRARKQLFLFACDAVPRWVRFDPRGWIPGARHEPHSDPQWLDLAANAPEAPARRAALRELARLLREGSKTLGRDELLAAVLARAAAESATRVRAEAMSALAGATEPGARAALLEAAENDAEARVRVAALESLSALGPDAELAALAERVFEAGYSWNVQGAAARLLAHAAPQTAYELLARALATPSPADVLAAAVVGPLLETGDARARESALALALDRTRGARLRGAAVRALGASGARDEALRATLVELVDDPERSVRGAAATALAGWNDARARRAIVARWSRTELAVEKRALEAVFRPADAAPIR